MTKKHINPVVFYSSAAAIFIFVLLGSTFTKGLSSFFGDLQDFIVTNFGWLYVISVAFFLFFVLWLLFSKYGHIKLGADGDKPDFSRASWFAMLFSAGMGIGLLFFSVAEPIMHFTNPKLGEGGTVDAARRAMTTTFFHWGLHAWAIYIVVGLALAYFSFRKGLPLTIRSTLAPILGDRIHGLPGDVVEIFAIFGTMFGVATSLGLGVQQINAGLEHLGLVDISQGAQLTLIALITLGATVSLVTGLDKGIRKLSEINLGLGLLLITFVFILGPTTFLLSSFVQSLGDYFRNIIPLMFRTDAFQDLDWQKGWTMFYWGWWISWSPFVGMFIARISKGRTIREFILGVMLVPTALTFLWLVVFGNTAIYMELFQEGSKVAAATAESVPTALYTLLDQLPLSSVTAYLATVVVATFFVTSSDSASLVIDTLACGGHPHPPIWQKIFWAFLEGAVAAVLLVVGGLGALQTAAITTALPFCVIMLLICYCLHKALRQESIVVRISSREPGRTVVSSSR